LKNTPLPGRFPFPLPGVSISPKTLLTSWTGPLTTPRCTISPEFFFPFLFSGYPWVGFPETVWINSSLVWCLIVSSTGQVTFFRDWCRLVGQVGGFFVLKVRVPFFLLSSGCEVSFFFSLFSRTVLATPFCVLFDRGSLLSRSFLLLVLGSPGVCSWFYGVSLFFFWTLFFSRTFRPSRMRVQAFCVLRVCLCPPLALAGFLNIQFSPLRQAFFFFLGGSNRTLPPWDLTFPFFFFSSFLPLPWRPSLQASLAPLEFFWGRFFCSRCIP